MDPLTQKVKAAVTQTHVILASLIRGSERFFEAVPPDEDEIDDSVTRTPVRAVRVQAYVRIGSRTIRSIRFIAMIPAVFICKLTTLFP